MTDVAINAKDQSYSQAGASRIKKKMMENNKMKAWLQFKMSLDCCAVPVIATVEQPIDFHE